jgi:hypothetical protein
MAARIPAGLLRIEGGTRIFVSTADARGTPHLASGGELACLPEDRVTVSYWLCPQTVANLGENPRCSVVVWDGERDEGYQLVGRAVSVREVEVLGGGAPAAEEPSIPQVKYAVTIEVQKVLEFRHAPHADTEVDPEPSLR